MATLFALLLLALSLWMAPRVARWILTLHDRDNCPVCAQRRERDGW